MRIDAVDAVIVSLNLNGTYATAKGRSTSVLSAVARLSFDDGVGWGEATPMPGFSACSARDVVMFIQAVAPRLKGAQIYSAEDLREVLRDIPQYCCAEVLSVIEMAYWDAYSRARGVPLYDALGTRNKDSVDLVGWLGVATPEDSFEAARGLSEAGFRVLKVKLRGSLRQDLSQVRAVRRAAPDTELRLDANGSYEFREAAKLLRGLAESRIQLVEQPLPVPELRQARSLIEESVIPICADEGVVSEAALMRIIDAGAADIVKLKSIKLGGLANTMRCAQIAAQAGLNVIVGHGFGCALSTFAEAHLIASSQIYMDGSEAVGALKIKSDPFVVQLKLKPTLEIPASPGIGVAAGRTLLNQLSDDVPPNRGTNKK